MSWFRKYCPIYINTLNIFRPLRTWWKNRNIAQIPHIKFLLKRRPFDWLQENFYTWYWWDHITIWNFPHKWIIILIDDVQYKYRFGLREMESIPFILIRMFGWNFIMKFSSPKSEDNYQYWERLK